MNKKDLIDIITEKTGLKKNVVIEVMNEAHEEIIRTLGKGDLVKISGFGTFHTVKRKTKKGRNPKTGKKIVIPPRTVPKFRPGKTMRETVK